VIRNSRSPVEQRLERLQPQHAGIHALQGARLQALHSDHIQSNRPCSTFGPAEPHLDTSSYTSTVLGAAAGNTVMNHNNVALPQQNNTVLLPPFL
jgi:hypothetical protein